MKKTIKTVLSIALVVNFQLSIISIIAAQDTSYMRYNLRSLTSERMKGRGYSFRGDSIAAEYIRVELKRLGVEPLVEGYYQPYTFSVHSMEGPVSVMVDKKRLEPYTQYRIPSWSKSSWGDYPIVKVPCETLIDAAKMKKFLNKNNSRLDDAFVYINRTTFKADNDEEQKKFDAIMYLLSSRNPFNSKGIIVGVKELSTYSPAGSDKEHSYAYIEVLASEMPRKAKKLNCNFFTQFHPRYQTQNIYGYVQGEVDTMIVYSAHYDHLGTMGDSIVFYGAHDNGSGVATLLDIARDAVTSKPHYTTVFCFFSGEEAGLKGSKYAVDHPVFDFSKVRLMINIDMFCGGDEGLMIFNANDPKTTGFVQRLEQINKALQIVPEIRRRDNRANSDHWFFSQKVPAIFILTMGQRYGGYHDPKDTCDRCGLENYINYVTLISALGL